MGRDMSDLPRRRRSFWLLAAGAAGPVGDCCSSLGVRHIVGVTVLAHGRRVARACCRDRRDRPHALRQGGRVYHRLLPRALERPWLVLGGAALAFVASIVRRAHAGHRPDPAVGAGSFRNDRQAAAGHPAARNRRAGARGAAGSTTATATSQALYGVSGTGTRLDANPTESGENIAKLTRGARRALRPRNRGGGQTERMRATMAEYPDVAGEVRPAAAVLLLHAAGNRTARPGHRRSCSAQAASCRG